MNAEIELMSGRVLGALLNGGAQGLVIALLAWAGLRMARRANAATRHAAGYAALLLMALLPLAHFWRGANQAEPPAAPAAKPEFQASPEPAGPRPAGRTLTEPGLQAPQPEPRQDQPRQHLPRNREFLQESARALAELEEAGQGDGNRRWDEAGPEARPEEPDARLDTSAELEMAAGTRAVEPPAADAARMAATEEVQPASAAAMMEIFKRNGQAALARLGDWLERGRGWARSERLLAMPSGAATALAGIWAGIAAMLLARLGWQCAVLRGWKRRAAACTEEAGALFEQCRVEMGVSRRARLMVSEEAPAPAALGFAHPAVLLPADLAEHAGSAELEQIFRHELAHVARRDDWANLAQQAIRAVFFFHPGILWLSRRLAVEREIACDDHVLAAGRSARSYALLLAEFARGTSERGRQMRHLAAASAAWGSKNQLKERIGMLMNKTRNTSTRLSPARAGIMTLGAVLTALLTLQVAPRIALGSSADDGPDSAPRPKPARAASAAITVLAAPSAAPAAPVSVPQPPQPPEAPAVLYYPATPAPAPAALYFSAAPTEGAVALSAPHPVPAAMPAPPMIVASAGHGKKPGRDESIEERIERLEELVRSLARPEEGPRPGKDRNKGEGKGEGGDMNFERKFNFQMKGPIGPDLERLKKDLGHILNEKEMAKIQKEVAEATRNVQKDIKTSMKHAQRAQADAQKTMREAQKKSMHGLIEEKRGQHEGARKGLENHRRTLEERKRGLEREMEKLEREIERLEEEQERIEEEQEKLEEKRSELESDSDIDVDVEIELEAEAEVALAENAEDHGHPHGGEHKEECGEEKKAENASNSNSSSSSNSSENSNESKEGGPKKKKTVQH